MLLKSFSVPVKMVCGVSIALLVGCSPAPKEEAKPEAKTSAEANDTSNSQKIIVYASTNVWGSVAKAVGGDKVEVIAGVNEPTQDPHDYEATANDKLQISKSALVLVNGGGYDDWAINLAKSVQPMPVVINAIDLSGIKPPTSEEKEHSHHEHEHHHHDHHEHGHQHRADFNEHVFFSLDTAKKVAEAVANQLSSADPNQKAVYAQNAQDFMQKIDTLKNKAQQVGKNKQLTALYTEPVVGYLLADMGIKNITPDTFIEQAETETGVAPKVLLDTKNIIMNKQASMLVLNAQTEDATSKVLTETAKTANIPVIKVYETLPPNVTTYTDFMEKTIDEFNQALNK